MVKRAEDYYWSSYPGYLWKKKRQAWMDYALILSQFGTREGASQKRYKAFVDKVEKTEMNPLNEVFGQTILGGEDFLKKVKQILRGKKVGKEIVNRKRFSERPRGAMVLSAVAKKLNIAEREIRETKKRGHIGRDLTVYLMKKYSDMTNGEIAAIFGGMHPSAITKIAQRTENKIQSDEDFKKIRSELISIFKA